MVIDHSALVAILLGEPERRAFNELIETATHRCLSTEGFVELSIVIEARRAAEGILDLDLFLATAGIELVAFDLAQARLAREGFRRHCSDEVVRGPDLRRVGDHALDDDARVAIVPDAAAHPREPIDSDARDRGVNSAHSPCRSCFLDSRRTSSD
jgi:uncharacterized protein with PIN domain